MGKLVLALLLLVLAGCKHPGSPKLEGRGKGQKAEGIPDTVQLQAHTFAIGSEILVMGNQITIATPGGRSTATYVVDKEDATTVVIHTDRDGANAETFSFEKAD